MDLDMRPYYNFSVGVRGKYVQRFAGSCKVVELEPDLAEVFPDAVSVNKTLRGERDARSEAREQVGALPHGWTGHAARAGEA
jgi:hypothetical protein